MWYTAYEIFKNMITFRKLFTIDLLVGTNKTKLFWYIDNRYAKYQVNTVKIKLSCPN